MTRIRSSIAGFGFILGTFNIQHSTLNLEYSTDADCRVT
jgi:hypothetical protein